MECEECRASAVIALDLTAMINRREWKGNQIYYYSLGQYVIVRHSDGEKMSKVLKVLTATAVILGLSLMPADGVPKPKISPGLKPVSQDLGQSNDGYLPVGQHWIETPALYKQSGLQFHCPLGYELGRTTKAGEPWTAATTTKGYMRSRWTHAKGDYVCTQLKSVRKAFPSWFPKMNPAVADIRRLGEQWGPETPLAVGLQIPMPDLSTCIPAVLPDAKLTELRSITPSTAEGSDGIEGSADATWTVIGGSGLMYQGYLHIGNPVWMNYPNYQGVAYYFLELGKTFPINVENSDLSSGGRVYNTLTKRSYDTWDVSWDRSAGVVPDCGQANLPQSLIAMWNIPRTSWVSKNGWHKSEFSVRVERILGLQDEIATPRDKSKVKPWVSKPGTDDN